MTEKSPAKDKLQTLLDKARELEVEILAEVQKKQKEFFYTIQEKRVRFEEEVRKRHKRLAPKIPRYVREAAPLNILTAPFIYSLIVPALMMDFFVTVYQAVCFPVYGISKVKRGEYVVIDRQYLQYLNVIEKINCVYCGYFNGLISYVREVAARTEKYWCAIKHARQPASVHRHYGKFTDYGDGEEYKKRLEKLKKQNGP